VHLDFSAMAQVVEYSSRLAEGQDNLSTHFGEIVDVIREASYYASLEGAPLIRARISPKRSRNVILTGVNAGVRLETGGFEEGSVNARVDQRLKELAEKIEAFGKAE
jgi:hypothetical protein